MVIFQLVMRYFPASLLSPVLREVPTVRRESMVGKWLAEQEVARIGPPVRLKTYQFIGVDQCDPHHRRRSGAVLEFQTRDYILR